MTHLSADELLSAGRMILLNKMPFFSTLLYNMQFIPNDNLEFIAATTDSGLMQYNPAMLLELKPEQIAGLLFHEANHVLRQTATRSAALVGYTIVNDMALLTEEQRTLQAISNIASDLAINQDLVAARLQHPKQILLINNFLMPPIIVEPINLPPNKTHEEYYAILAEAYRNWRNKNKNNSGMVPNPGCSCGRDHKESRSKLPVTNERTVADMQRIIRDTAQQIANTPGHAPGSLSQWASKEVAPSVIPWQQKLRTAVRSGVQLAIGASEVTWRKLSKKQAGIGYGAMRPVAPGYASPIISVEYVFDTSGSMAHIVSEGMQEVEAIAKALRAPFSFVAIDTTIQADVKVARGADAMHHLRGGGGTVFTELFERYTKMRQKAPSVVVCWTDGYIYGVPESQPANISKWYWLMPEGQSAPMPWGEIILVPKAGNKC